jgi:anti-sigma B factor antagonist
VRVNSGLTDEATRSGITVTRSGKRVVIELVGAFDTDGRLAFRERIRELLGRGGDTVVVDVGGLRSVDIPTLAALLRADLLLRAVQSSLRVRAATPAFMALLRSTGLSGRLPVDP